MNRMKAKEAKTKDAMEEKMAVNAERRAAGKMPRYAPNGLEWRAGMLPNVRPPAGRLKGMVVHGVIREVRDDCFVIGVGSPEERYEFKEADLALGEPNVLDRWMARAGLSLTPGYSLGKFAVRPH